MLSRIKEVKKNGVIGLAKAQSNLKVNYDPSMFVWHDATDSKYSKWRKTLTVRVSERGLYLSSRAADIVKKTVEPKPDGGYAFKIGTLEKALALMPLPPHQHGFVFRNTQWGLFCHCSRFVDEHLSDKLTLPITLYLIWDEKHHFFVAKFPGADTPKRRRAVYDWL